MAELQMRVLINILTPFVHPPFSWAARHTVCPDIYDLSFHDFQIFTGFLRWANQGVHLIQRVYR